MAEFATCSQDSVVLWDYKSVSCKRSVRPFGGSGYHIQSAAWSSSSITPCGSVFVCTSVELAIHSYLVYFLTVPLRQQANGGSQVG